MDQSPRALVSAPPIPDFHDRELDDTSVDHITGMRADLDSITEIEGATQYDEDPTRKVRDDVLQRDCKPR